MKLIDATAHLRRLLNRAIAVLTPNGTMNLRDVRRLLLEAVAFIDLVTDDVDAQAEREARASWVAHQRHFAKK